jgi:uncharacterized BrkB/YihY/UPF0761 family membrane protein
MTARRVRTVLAAALALVPARAAACPACLSSAFGDRSYTWPYIALILLPLVVSGVILGVVLWYRRAPRVPSPRTHTETT